MRRFILLTIVLLIPVSLKAQTIEASSPSEAVQQEADRIRQFKKSLGMPLTPVAPDGIQPIPLYAPNPGGSSVQTHIVVKGDTLFGLSKRFGVSVSDIRTTNQLNGNHLSIGQSLSIPVLEKRVEAKPSQRIVEPVPDDNEIKTVSERLRPRIEAYAVLPKDNLSMISRRSCVPIAKLIELNDLGSPDQLVPGQRLRLPADHCLPN